MKGERNDGDGKTGKTMVRSEKKKKYDGQRVSKRRCLEAPSPGDGGAGSVVY